MLIADGPSSQSADDPPDTALAALLVARHITPDWELENIVVAPDARRRGLGKRLLEALLAHAHETNSESVFLEVRESNAAARALYDWAGFQIAGIRKSYYVNPLEAAVLYRREVRKPFSE